MAVLPDYRRRGIGYQLMEAAIQHARQQGGRRIALQVREDNEAAKSLYESLGFRTLDTVAELQTHYVDEPDWVPADTIQTRLPDSARWREAYHVASASVPPAAQIMHPIRPSRFRSSPPTPLLEWLRYAFLGYKQDRHWAEQDGRLLGIVDAERRRGGRASKLELIVHPDGRGLVETALLRPALRFLRGEHLVRTQLPIELNHAIELLRDIGFVPVRTLDQMVLEL